MIKYQQFLLELDSRLEKYFQKHKDFIQCKISCSGCCEKGDYPISQLELEYLMQGFIELDNEIKQKVQQNFRSIEKGGACPFLINKKCSIYSHRPIICRVHGLAYLCKDNTAKLPYCVNNGKNYANVYNNGEISFEPIQENLDTPKLLKKIEFGEIRNLYNWIQDTSI